MAFNYSLASNWRGRLVLEVPPGTPGRGEHGMKAYGLWNRGELTLGADGQQITDPEDGDIPVGGKQTAENLPISRPYKRTRDRAVFAELNPIRGRASGKFYIHELDDFGNPTTSSPIVTLDVVLLQVVLPEGAADSSDPSVFAAELQVKP